MLKQSVNKKELYVFNYRYSYLTPVCSVQEDAENIKILVNPNVQFETDYGIDKLIFDLMLIIISGLLTFTFELPSVALCITLGYIIFVKLLPRIFHKFASITKSQLRIEVLSINKQNGTISLLLYEDFSIKNTNLIDLPIEVVSKIIIVKELKLKEVTKLVERPTGSNMSSS